MKYCSLAFFLIVLAHSVATAQYTFDLVQDDSSVLATLSLADLSSDPADILSLTFSPRGQELFGYGAVYGGTFDVLTQTEDFGRFALEADGIGLTGRSSHVTNSIAAYDGDPPATALPGIEAAIVSIIAQDVVGGTDAIRLGYTDPASPFSTTYVDGFGTWQLVPEPSGMALSSALCVLMAVCRRRKI